MKAINLIKPYFLEKRRLIFFGILCLIVVDFLQLFIPRIIKWAIDDITTLRIDLIRLSYYAFYIVVIAILIGLFRYGWRRCLIGTSRRVEEGLRNRLFAHIQTLSASFFDKTKTGDIMAHATNDIQHVRMATGMGMVALTDSIVLGSAAIGFMAYINIRLTLFALIPMPLIIFGTRFFSKKMHRLYQEVQGIFSDLTEVVRERFTGIRIIKAHNMERYETAKLKQISNDYIISNLKLIRITGSFFPMMLLFTNISLAIVLYFGGQQTIDLTITPGDFVAFISYLGLLTWPMMAIGWVTNLLQRGRASLDRIDKILQIRPEIDDRAGAEKIKSITEDIVFENVSFSYGVEQLPALTKINIKLDKGKVLGIVGASGSGKTTFVNLIPRLLDVTGGRITSDSKDIRKIRFRDLRSQISFMPQEPFLFAGTIRENILFGNKAADEKALKRAVQDASLYSTIQSFSDGFETEIGEKGIILSGGQKQRIALARTLLRNASFLILDDPISQVDMETGKAIINKIMSMAGIKTIVLVSHRLSAVKDADRIIVLDRGSIIESGTHEQLMQNGKYYAKTFHLQKIEEELDAY